MKPALLFALGAAVTGGLCAPAHADTWDLPMAYSASNFHSQVGAAFGACVEAGTQGRIEIVTHPEGSLFAGSEIKHAVQDGQAPMGERLLSAHRDEHVLFGIDSIPFLATSYDDAERLWKIVQPEVEQLLDEQNLVYLYSIAWPPLGLYVDKPVGSLDDLKGIRFLAHDAVAARLAHLAGMLPVKVEAGEQHRALAPGDVQSLIASGAAGFDRKAWAHLSHFYTVDAWLPRNVVFVNKNAWSRLPEAERTVLRDCAENARTDGLERSKAYTRRSLEALIAHGIRVEPPSARLRSELRVIGATMTDEWVEAAGALGKTIVEQYRR